MITESAYVSCFFFVFCIILVALLYVYVIISFRVVCVYLPSKIKIYHPSFVVTEKKVLLPKVTINIARNMKDVKVLHDACKLLYINGSVLSFDEIVLKKLYTTIVS